MRVLWILGLAALAACGKTNSQTQEVSAPQTEASIEAVSGDAAPEGQWFIAAANPHAAEAGAAILRKGGSAADAAVATLAVLGLVEPQSSGFGGGAFMLYYNAETATLETYDGREVAPASATPERFLTETGAPMGFYDAVASGLSVGVPGAVHMLELAHDDHGVLPWDTLFVDAIALSENGFEVSPRLNGLLKRFPRVKTMPVAAAYFYDEEGTARPVGHVLKNPAYAETLRRVQQGGADAFYQGEIAEGIVAAINGAPNPGGMSLEDFAAYEAVKREPVCGFYRMLQVCSMAPPSSGGVTLLQILGLLENFDLTAAGPHSVDAMHLIFEASRLAYADREQYLADNEMLAGEGGPSTGDVIAGLLNPAYINARAARIDPAIAAVAVSAGDPSAFETADGVGKWRALAKDASLEPPSTSHFVIVDAKGDVVSMTATVEFAFGSHLMSGGMILNNQLTDFSFLPERDGVPVANAVAPGKRPRSSMSPVMVFDDEGELWGALGSPGGSAIIGYVAKTLIAMVDWGMTPQQAIDLENVVYPRGAPLVEEGGIDEQVIETLRERGHEITVRELNSGVHAFRVEADGSFLGGADKRREGIWLTGAVEEASQQ